MPIIITDDGKVKLIKEVIEKEIPFQEFMEQMAIKMPIIAPLLPDGCKSISVNDDFTNVVIEKPTGETFFDHCGAGYRLHMPWTYYRIAVQNNPLHIRQVDVIWSASRLMALNDVGFVMHFPNIKRERSGGAGIMCLGDIYIKANLPYHMAINDLIDAITSGEYGNDYFTTAKIGGVPSGLLPQGVNCHPGDYFNHWAKLTKELTDRKFRKIFQDYADSNEGRTVSFGKFLTQRFRDEDGYYDDLTF